MNDHVTMPPTVPTWLSPHFEYRVSLPLVYANTANASTRPLPSNDSNKTKPLRPMRIFRDGIVFDMTVSGTANRRQV